MQPTLSVLDYVTNPMVIFGGVLFLIAYLGTQRPPPEQHTTEGKPKRDWPVIYTFIAAIFITASGLYSTFSQHQTIQAAQTTTPTTQP